MSITTKDCVAYIVEKLAPNTFPKDWKRIQKLVQHGEEEDGDKSYIYRCFQHKVTGDMLEVNEVNGQLSGVTLVDAKIQDSDDFDPWNTLMSEDTRKTCMDFMTSMNGQNKP